MYGALFAEPYQQDCSGTDAPWCTVRSSGSAGIEKVGEAERTEVDQHGRW